MVDRVEPPGIEIERCGAIADERVVLVGVPKGRHNLHELAGALVSIRMVRQPVEPEIECGMVLNGGNHVPCPPAMAQMIERGEIPCDVVRFGERGGYSRAEAESLGRHSYCREEGHRLEPGHESSTPTEQ